MKKLSRHELEELQLWQKRMIAVFSATMAALLLTVGVDLVFGMSPTTAWIVFLLLLLLVGLGGLIQFSQKCPGCGYRIGFQSRLLVPDKCRKCGVKLK